MTAVEHPYPGSKEPNSSFCEPCQRVFNGDWTPADAEEHSTNSGLSSYQHHVSVSALRACVRDYRCPLCFLAVSQGSKSWHDLPEDDWPVVFYAVVTHAAAEDSGINMGIRLCPMNLDTDATYIALRRVDSFSAAQKFLCPPKLESNTSSPASIAFAKSKLDTCLAKHDRCVQVTETSSTGFLPTRLLDIRCTDSDQPVRLVEKSRLRSPAFASFGTGLQYATLSHCWGGAQVVRLMIHNKSALETSGLQIDSLPKTFRHAISVARSLDIRYLWIDSLCIVQDSVADWERESSLMGTVYTHGTVNIAATSSSDSAGGLFYDRDPLSIAPFAAHSSIGGHKGFLNGWYVYENISRVRDIGQEPLNRRAWVLQERLLSPRTLHFTSTEVVWQCLEDMGCEAMPDQRHLETTDYESGAVQRGDYPAMKSAMAVLRDQQYGSRASAVFESARVTMYKGWDQMIRHYSDCGLTMQSDKLVAISGMVGLLETLTGDECLAGLWRGNMPGCLLWTVRWQDDDTGANRVDLVNNKCPKQVEWRAPSWSWASLNLPVESPQTLGVYTDRRTAEQATVIEATVQRKPNGSLKDAKLVLRGPLVQIDSVQAGSLETRTDHDVGTCTLSVAGGLRTT